MKISEYREFTLTNHAHDCIQTARRKNNDGLAKHRSEPSSPVSYNPQFKNFSDNDLSNRNTGDDIVECEIRVYISKKKKELISIF